MVNVNLLMKRQRIMGFPDDIVELIKVWLSNRLFYVSIDGKNSILYELLLGTVQGSILGPVLYAIFASPMFKIADLDAFADDTFFSRWNRSLPELIFDMEQSIEAIIKWLRQSDLKVNQNKTEACLLYKHDLVPITIRVGDAMIATKKLINVSESSVQQWDIHILKVCDEANKSSNALKLIKKNTLPVMN
jgi:hypothetical protein